jgi:polygalacturonase
MLDVFQKLRSGEIIEKDSAWLVKRPGTRAMVLSFESCTGVTVSGVTLKNASGWVQDYVECDTVLIKGITVQSTTYWNNDGLDITDSKNVHITKCFVNAADDGICIKSNNPTSISENILIDSCTVRSSASGLKFGTASAGIYKKVKVRDLLIFDTYRSAIAIESVDGG